MVNFLSQQIKDQSKGSLFFPSIRKVRRKDIELKSESFYWGAPDYKIYPSAIKSWGQCPKTFIENAHKFNGITQIEGIYRTRRGTAIHNELQKDFLLSDKLAPKPQNITDPRILRKLEDNWPEVPFHDLDSGVSGSIDAVYLLRKEIIPIEIKSTNLSEEDWEKAIQTNFPRTRTQWTIQTCIYLHYLNKLNYYPDFQVKRGIVAVINGCIDPANPDGEHEIIIDFEEYREKIEKLLDSYSLQRYYLMNNKEGECTNPYCNEHN